MKQKWIKDEYQFLLVCPVFLDYRNLKLYINQYYYNRLSTFKFTELLKIENTLKLSYVNTLENHLSDANLYLHVRYVTLKYKVYIYVYTLHFQIFAGFPHSFLLYTYFSIRCYLLSWSFNLHKYDIQCIHICT